MDLNLSAADLTLVALIVGIGGILWFTGSGSEYTPSAFCQETAVAAEGNLSRGYTGVDCSCEDPGKYISGINATTPNAVMNVTDVNDVLVCDTNEFEDSMTFPLMKINQTKYNMSGGLNGSLDRSMFANAPLQDS